MNSFIICIVRYFLCKIPPCFYIIVIEAMAVSSIPLLAITENISHDSAPAVAPNVASGDGKINVGLYARVQAQDKEKRATNGKK